MYYILWLSYINMNILKTTYENDGEHLFDMANTNSRFLKEVNMGLGCGVIPGEYRIRFR